MLLGTILYFLILAVTAQIFYPTVGLVIPTRTQTNEANAEIKTAPVTVQAKMINCST